MNKWRIVIGIIALAPLALALGLTLIVHPGHATICYAGSGCEPIPR